VINHVAYWLEELDQDGKVVWSILSAFPPSELTWTQDLKSKKHNLRIKPLVVDIDAIHLFTEIKKYDSKRMVEADSGL
jgi:hypothetical protein